MTRLKKSGFIALVSALVLASCGGSDGGAENSAVAEAIADEFMTDEDSPFTEGEASCAAGKIVSALGEDRLAELGVTADNVGDIDDVDFSEDEQAVLGNAVADCIGEDFLTRAFLTDSDISDDQASCLSDAIDLDTVRDLARSSFAGDGNEPPEELLLEIMGAMSECEVIPGG